MTEQLKKAFAGRESFSRQELLDFYRNYEPDLKETTFRWRIYALKEKKMIQAYSKDLFSFTYRPVYKPEFHANEKKIITQIKKQFDDLKMCIWSTQILNEFMLHQPTKTVTILEVEKDALEPVFHFLKDLLTSGIYLKPEQKELELYVYDGPPATIIETLVSKSPIQTIKKIPTVTLEKIIVDIFTDKQLFSTYQGSELANIINAAYSKYQIDFTRLFSYAKRRRKEADLMEYLLAYTDIPQNILND
ncbi:hypothetical protein OC25_17610 [Pedobacter kyungheensis]|uniref:Uncharacterized protein n=1 Tax=Pedobacter kyungheensis TaxID=1069985 RepID=A0A0C1D5J8_9SPHI|nr:hypothetical protein OC25_17610 [Pedobacter kyungheensis]